MFKGQSGPDSVDHLDVATETADEVAATQPRLAETGGRFAQTASQLRRASATSAASCTDDRG